MSEVEIVHAKENCKLINYFLDLLILFSNVHYYQSSAKCEVLPFVREELFRMAKVTISEVEPLQPECLFTDPFKFKIRFNCIEDLQDDLDWKIIYVGSANSNQHDQGKYSDDLLGPSVVIFQTICMKRFV